MARCSISWKTGQDRESKSGRGEYWSRAIIQPANHRWDFRPEERGRRTQSQIYQQSVTFSWVWYRGYSGSWKSLKKISPNTFQICAIQPLKTTKPQTFPALDWSRAMRISRSVSGACATSCVAGAVKEGRRGKLEASLGHCALKTVRLCVRERYQKYVALTSSFCCGVTWDVRTCS